MFSIVFSNHHGLIHYFWLPCKQLIATIFAVYHTIRFWRFSPTSSTHFRRPSSGRWYSSCSFRMGSYLRKLLLLPSNFFYTLIPEHIQEGGTTAEPVLRHVDLQIVDRRTCQSNYILVNAVTERMVCAAVDGGGKDACQVDKTRQDKKMYYEITNKLYCF